MDENVKIAWRPAKCAGFTLTGQAQAGTVIDAGGDLDRDFFTGHHLPRSVAFRTGVNNDLATTTAGWAGGADGKKTLAAGNLSGTPAMSAVFRFSAGFATVAIALFAYLPLFDLDLGFDSKHRLHKIKAQIIPQIHSGRCPTP